MGNTDSLPVVSQVKSGVQLVCGDVEGAARTQERFLHECPVVSQVTSGVYLLAGEGEKALETQKRCGKGLLNAADGIPVVGHVKGVVHYAVGDKEGGHKAMKSATRTTGVLAGGAGGFLVGGPVGAVAGGIYGGAVTDVGTTAVTGESSGYVAAIENAVKNPNPGDIFDLCLMPVADGLAGHSAGTVVRRLTTPKSTAPVQGPSTGPGGGAAQGQSVMQTQADLVKAGELRVQANAILEAAEANKLNVPEIQTLTEMSKAQKLWNAANKLEGKVEVASPKVVAPTAATTSTATTHVVIPAESGSSRDKESDDQDERSKRQKKQQQQRAAASAAAAAAAAAEAERQRQRAKVAHRTRESSRGGASRHIRESDSDSDKECICEDISIPVLYVNMRSVNPKNPKREFNEKIAKLKALIASNQPAIIAIVETWLKVDHDDMQVAEKLQLVGYEIWRQDRHAGHPEGNAYKDDTTGMEGRSGGGILLAWKASQLPNGYRLQLERDTSEDFGDNILSGNIFVQLNCKECNEILRKKFGFSIIYRRPPNMKPKNKMNHELELKLDGQVRERVTHLLAVYTDELTYYDGWSLVGDFNFRGGIADRAFQGLLRFAGEGTNVFPGPETATHVKGGCLDMVVASDGHFDGGCLSREPVSDHYAIIYKLKLGEDYSRDEECEACNE